MKIVYCIQSVHNSGGMERVLANKANYLVEKLNYEVVIITTDRKNRSSFFQFSPKVKFIDLGINYEDTPQNLSINKLFVQKSKMALHRKRLADCLKQIKPDISISMFGMEVQFLHRIKDGSKKVLEFHFSKRYKIIEAKSFKEICFQRVRLMFWNAIIPHYDKFIVLTNRDFKDWGSPKNGCVIPNMIIGKKDGKIKLGKKCNHTVMAAGRLTYQKGFDMLINAWQEVKKKYPDWILRIFGEGEQRKFLQEKIKSMGLEGYVFLEGRVNNLMDYMIESDVYVMSSRYEGFPMVLLEAMAVNIPCVSFDCPCGPSDIITNKIDGVIVTSNDVKELSTAIQDIIKDESYRNFLKSNIRKKIEKFSENKIMNQWDSLFNALIDPNIG